MSDATAGSAAAPRRGPVTSDDVAHRRDVRRAPVVAVLLVALVAAVLVGSAGTPASVGSPPPPAVSMPPTDARSSAWFCTGGPLVSSSDGEDAAPLEIGDQAVSITNLGDEATTARVTALADSQVAASEVVDLAAGAVVVTPLRELTDAPVPGVVVEPFAPDVVVEQVVHVDDGVALGPCATAPGPEWYFAAGTTVRGAEMWLSLFNPFGDDAVVDVALATTEGVREPEEVHGLVVPRRSRVDVRLDQVVFREAQVATTVSARSGRVVAAQSQVLAPEDGQPREGVTLSLGATAPATEWHFAGGPKGGRREISVSNPGDLATEVDVQVVPTGQVTVDPLTVEVPRRSAVVVRIGSDLPDDAADALVVPSDVAYSVAVRSAGDQPIVAEQLSDFDGEGDPAVEGAVTVLGTSRPATRWVLGRSRLRDQDYGAVLVSNPGAEAVTVDVGLVRADGVVTDDRLSGLELGPGARRSVRYDRVDERDGGVVVEASGPVVVERFLARGAGATDSPAVPAAQP